ncbi:MAG: hypothetical protein IT371_19025 [Deltaproteobacteria bacterium]|nr:hypothetical protein [Deltaproteobacteria bacterium]
MKRVLGLLVLGLGAGAAGCGSELVEVSLVRGECEDQALLDVVSTVAELRRADGVGVERCINVGAGRIDELVDLAGLLAERVQFADLPAGGDWTLWVRGFAAADCDSSPILCGKVTRMTLPPPGSRVTLGVHCVPRLAAEKPERLKACLVKE